LEWQEKVVMMAGEGGQSSNAGRQREIEPGRSNPKFEP